MTEYSTIKEFLINTFGDSAKNIDGIDNEWLGLQKCIKPQLMGCGDKALLQVYCSGECLISFSQGNLCRGCIYLIRDDTDSKDWEYRSHANKLKLHEPKPFARLRLVSAA